jgi:hypothetical protein
LPPPACTGSRSPMSGGCGFSSGASSKAPRRRSDMRVSKVTVPRD